MVIDSTVWQQIEKATFQSLSEIDNVSPAMMKNILHLQKAFHMAPPTTKDCNVKRNIKLEVLKTMAKSAGLNHLDEIQSGTILSDDGIISTSHKEKWNWS